MSKIYTVEEESLKAIIDVPREIIGIDGEENKFPLSEFPNMIYNAVGYVADSVGQSAYEGGLADGFNNGYEQGYGEGMNNGIEAGGYIAQGEFWDKFQDYGNRTDYQFAFAGETWTEENLTPYYDISGKTLSNTYMMFAKGKVANLKTIFPTIVTQVSQYMFFSNTTVTDLGTIVLYDEGYGTFSGCSNLKNIDQLVFAWDNPNAKDYNSTFNTCSSLENVYVSGAGHGIRGGLALGAAKKLSRSSIESFIYALSTEVTGKTISFSQAAVNKAFETSAGANNGSTSAAWLELVNMRPNWTVSLV